MTTRGGLIVLAAVMALAGCGGEDAPVAQEAATPVVIATNGDSSLSTGEPQEVTVIARIVGQRVCTEGDVDVRVTLDVTGAGPGTTLVLTYAVTIPTTGSPAKRTATAAVADDGSATFGLEYQGAEELADLIKLTVGPGGPEVALEGPRAVSLDAGSPEPC